MKSFVITIKEVPESVTLGERCIASLAQFAVSCTYFWAVTPKDDPIKMLFERGIPTQGFYERYSRTQNAMSCFLSHYSLWEKCASGEENFMIMEHDAVFFDAPPDTDFKGVLSVGKPSYGRYVTPSFIGVNKLVSKQYLPGAHAYMLKPSAAKALIKRAKIDAKPTDVFMCNSRFDFLEEWYPWCAEVRETFSTVQNVQGCLAKHQYRKNPENYKILQSPQK